MYGSQYMVLTDGSEYEGNLHGVGGREKAHVTRSGCFGRRQ